MIFSSLSFLFVFLPLLVIIYYSVPSQYDVLRKYILLLFSVVFYAMGEPIYIFLILGCVLITWYFSGKIASGSKYFLVLLIIINLLPLVVLKYSGFIARNMMTVIGVRLDFPEISLPVGISFYTFQILAYLVDLYKGKVKRQCNVAFLALYILLFPQLIAGPIVRYQDVENAIENNCTSWDRLQYGFGRFIIGLSKKVLIANQVGFIVDKIMSQSISSLSSQILWLAVIAFTLQIYYDFSGYSDMAIGLGSIFGFTFPENFNMPYISTSISEFWRRWHITLGSFFRDYVYIPLGGNRVKTTRWIFNIFIVWILTGLWHGAEWNFAIWGGVLRTTTFN